MEDCIVVEKIKIKRLVRHKIAHSHPSPEKASFCPVCGEALQEIDELVETKCSSCERIIGFADEFCCWCGKHLVDNGAIIYTNGKTLLSLVEYEEQKKNEKGKRIGAPQLIKLEKPPQGKKHPLAIE